VPYLNPERSWFRPRRRLAVLGALVIVPLAALSGGAAAKPPPSTVTTLLRVAFASPIDGFALFQTETSPADDAGPPRCALYTVPTSNGGISFGNQGNTIATTSCDAPAGVSGIAVERKGRLLAYGPELKFSRDFGGQWKTAKVPGPVAGLVVAGKTPWALVVTRCRQLSCTVELYNSADEGATWHPARKQPPIRSVASLVARAAEGGTNTLLSRSASGRMVIALPEPQRRVNSPVPTTARVAESNRTDTRWGVSTAPCNSGGWTSELSVASTGALWLACAAQPGAGGQLKTVARAGGAGRRWQLVAASCTTRKHCENALTVNGYLGGLYALSATTAFYVGGRSSLTSTRDSGKSWRPFGAIGGEDTGTAQVTFFNAHDGWAVAQDAYYTSSTLWRTRDGGRTWSPADPVS
jgi:hypothetical protein